MSQYLIPLRSVRIELRVSNSRFIGSADRADSVRQAQAYIRQIRAEMPDASHHVHAFRIGHGASISEGMSDDGEPSGTSGPPILAVLRGSAVGDVVVVVTRYFGGTKLGTGGLVSAYGATARAVLEALPTEQKIERVAVDLAVPYAIHAAIRRLISDHAGIIESEVFADRVVLELQLPVECFDDFARAVRDASSGSCDPQPRQD